MDKLTLTREQPHQTGFYWMVEDGFQDRIEEYPEVCHMVELLDMGNRLWVCGFTNGYLSIFYNYWWAGPIPLPEMKR